MKREIDEIIKLNGNLNWICKSKRNFPRRTAGWVYYIIHHS